MKTYSSKPADVKRQWHLLDASETTLGRLSTAAASLLLGKAKVTTSPHIDNGDYVVVINAKKLNVTGGKEGKKVYYRHSGFPGGIYKRTLQEQAELDVSKLIEHAIRGMLPDNKLRKGRLARLKIYTDNEHANAGQNPQPYNLGGKK